MSRKPGRGYEAIVVGGWIAAMVAIAYAGNTNGGMRFALAVGVSVLAGYLVGRWWVLLVPAIASVILVALTMVDDDLADITFGEAVLIYSLATVILGGCMAMGVAARRRTTDAPGTPGTPRSPSPPSAPPPPPPPPAP